MPTEQLILRRVFPVPVTFADLRAAWPSAVPPGCAYNFWRRAHKHVSVDVRNVAAGTVCGMREDFTAALKEATGAIDEVYAVVDGREVRVAIVNGDSWSWTGALTSVPTRAAIDDLLIKADEAGYWKRPHEVRHVLEESQMSHKTMARIAANSIIAAGVK